MDKNRQQRINANRDAWRAAQKDITYTAPKNLTARRKAEKHLGAWAKRYMPEAFCLPWAEFHQVSIQKLISAIDDGGSFAIALPRGSGKTTLCKAAMLWAMLSGRKRFVLVVCATAGKAKSFLQDIKDVLRFNPKLMADYPEVCAPIAALGGTAIKAKTQTAFGEPTLIEIGAGQLVLPNTKRLTKKGTAKNPAAGSVCYSCGITGDIRGCQFTTPDGTVLRPDLILVDDPQTRESAKSVEQTNFREGVIKGDLAASEGTMSRLSIIMPCTVIERGDLADRILDHEQNPDFRGERHPLVTGMPENMDLWDEYNAARVEGLELDDHGKRANAFYKKNRAKLDKGCVATWPDRKVGRVSAIQYAMDKYFMLGEGAFQAEYQNEPIKKASVFEITTQDVMSKVNSLKLNQAPANAQIITGFVDINRAGLHWALCAFSDPLAGYVMNYGKYPVRGDLWPLNANQVEVRKAIGNGLASLLSQVASFKIMRDGVQVPIDLFMIDAGYEGEAVYNFIRFAKYGISIHASRGFAHHRYNPHNSTVVANSQRDGCHMADTKTGHRFIAHDACAWREWTHKGFLSEPGLPGSMSIYGEKPLEHKTLAEHICNEPLLDIAVGDKGKVYQWGALPGPHDLSDAVTGCVVGAAYLGFAMDGQRVKKLEIKRPLRRRK